MKTIARRLQENVGCQMSKCAANFFQLLRQFSSKIKKEQKHFYVDIFQLSKLSIYDVLSGSFGQQQLSFM
jgi:hypothetical protein